MTFEDRVRALYPDLAGTIYMNTASLAAGSRPAADALVRAAEAWARGRFDFVDAEAAGEDARAAFARLVNANVADVVLIPTVSTVSGLVAVHLAMSVPVGNVVVGAAEFTSNQFTWRMLERHGWEVRLVEEGWPAADAFARAVDAKTRLLATSLVQSATGYRADLDALRDIADRSGALLFVDASQIAGALPVDFEKARMDAMAAPSHKFLTGTRGFGYAVFSEALRLAMTPVLAGWKAGAEPFASFYGPQMRLSTTASRFDTSVAWFNAMAERASMRALEELGFEAVHRHNERLAATMRGALIDSGIPFADHGPDRGSTIFAVEPHNANAG